MASGPPMIRQIAWISVVPQLAAGALVVLVADRLGADNPLIVGVATYLIVFLIVRRLVASDHRKGVTFVRKEKFDQAVQAFENSYRFFCRHKWIDRYRYITLLSSSAMSYREMALVNIAFCHSQTGNGGLAKAYYERALAEFPDSRIAGTALRMIASARELDDRDRPQR